MHTMLRRIVPWLLALVVTGCVNVDPDSTGAETYDFLCSRCHGSQLEGEVGPPLGAGSAAAAQSDEYLVTVIERGRGAMPSFSATLTEDQITSVVAYLREEQAG